MIYPEHDLVGDSPAMSEVLDFIARAAGKNANVLIEGEIGTGKEHVARALHRNSRRSKGPFVAVDCPALVEGVLEDEVGTYEGEASTGRRTQRKGRFDLAAGGTLFLDEIGGLAPWNQWRLLRAIEYGEIDRIGGVATHIPTNTRLITATTRHLKSAVADGDFRQDLYYRLAILFLRMPPLRERREDIPALIRHFISKLANKAEGRILDISPEAESILCNYHWPGNVLELKNVVQYAVVFASTDVIQPLDLPNDLSENPNVQRNLKWIRKQSRKPPRDGQSLCPECLRHREGRTIKKRQQCFGCMGTD